MSSAIETLFEPLPLGRATARNRLSMAPMSVGYGTPDGFISPKQVEHYARRAAGGVGTVFTENFAVSLGGRQMPLQPIVSGPEHLPGLTALADAVHRHGALAMVQLVHSGRYGGPWEEYEARRRLSPSAVAFELLPGREVMPDEITRAEIDETIAEFVNSARLCEQAGLDGVDIHAAQGFLLSGFLSPRHNLRTDEYGGDFDGRTRLVREVVRAVREATSKDFVVGVHLMSDELIDGGWSIAEAARLAPLLADDGAEFLFAIPSTFETLRLPENLGLLGRPGYSLGDTAALSAATDIPVIANGALSDPDLAARTVTEGKAAGIALARALFVDPDWPNKMEQDRRASVRSCPCHPPLCLQTQLTGAQCDHWPPEARERGYLGFEQGVPS
ncbi:oxidoreductase [Tsukamurella spumae]|uniref:NADH:flavin oxidoreductase n=1 Tax=Tsukamurella spumae TaxID=44753 RepID=A0A846X3U2_9ACTN|nr:NADH:flavin oxidoreductase [Tsukamurella spumae]NKY19771.1 NADH:flavin oxidoreductase [Tsukamurella spumae]